MRKGNLSRFWQPSAKILRLSQSYCYSATTPCSALATSPFRTLSCPYRMYSKAAMANSRPLLKPSLDPHHDTSGCGSEASCTSPDTSAAVSSCSTLRTLRLHNSPKNWLHDDILQFIDQVAQFAGILPPTSPSLSAHTDDKSNPDTEIPEETVDTEEINASAIPSSRSPFVHHLTIFFGRRTGIVFGSPRIVINNSALCNVLLKGIPFDEDDYRARIYFTEEKSSKEEKAEAASPSSATRSGSALEAIEESLEREKALALEHLELDRYLFAPDLLYDIERLHQRRLLTRNESVLLSSFTDGAEDEIEDSEKATSDDDTRDILPENVVKQKKRGKSKKNRRWKAGDQPYLGRGSMQNMRIPKPYVEGRKI